MKWWWLGVVSLSMAQVSFNVGPNVVAINEYVQFQVIVEGKGSELPHFPQGFEGADFSLARSSPDRQSSMTIVNGQVSQKMVYTYLLKPNRKGKVQIPAQTIRIKGKDYKSRAYALEVGDEKRSVGRQQSRRSDPFENFFGRSDRRRQQRNANAEIFVEAEVPKTSYYLGEPIPFSVKIYRTPGVEITNSGSSMDLPKFDNFWSEEIETNQEIKRVRRDDKVLEAILVDKRQLFASKSGALTIPPANFQLTVALSRGFFADWQTVNRSTKPLKIDIKPLPASGKPADFSGAVGSFRVVGELDKSKIALGESASLKVEVIGKGNFNALSELSLPELGHQFEIFDGGAPVVEKSGGVPSKKTWVFALVPKREGKFDIALPQFSYFDLKTKTYKKTEVKTFPLEVEGGEGLVASGPVGGERSPLMASQNLNYIMQGPLGPVDMSQKLRSPRPLFWVIGGFLLLNLMLFAGRKIRGQMLGSAAQSRPKLALKHCLKTLDQLGSEQDHEAFHAGLAGAIFAYFGDKWGRAAQGISLEDVQDFFNRKALDKTLTQSLVDVVETCEQARFTPASAGSRSQVLDEARQVLRRIDEVMA